MKQRIPAPLRTRAGHPQGGPVPLREHNTADAATATPQRTASSNCSP